MCSLPEKNNNNETRMIMTNRIMIINKNLLTDMPTLVTCRIASLLNYLNFLLFDLMKQESKKFRKRNLRNQIFSLF